MPIYPMPEKPRVYAMPGTAPIPTFKPAQACCAHRPAAVSVWAHQ